MMKTSSTTRRLTVSAMMLALAAADTLICQFIPFLNFPFGGGLTLASMLPIVLLSYLYGIRWGLFSGLCYAVLQLMIQYATVSALFLPTSDSYMGVAKALLICLLDYGLAYMVLGLGGVLRKTKLSDGWALALGSAVALTARYACHILSGFLFYGEWASWFFEQEGIYSLFGEWVLTNVSGNSLSLLYSAVYNGAYMLPEILLTFAVSFFAAHISYVRLGRLNKV